MGENVFEEILVDGKIEKIVVEINDGSVEENNIILLENTIDLSEVVEEIKNGE